MAKSGERRRGAALEAALLKAAWDELVAVGYARFTIEGVVARAGTSRPVIYRRWANRHELALAVLKAQFAAASVEVPDTGNVRDDLVALLGSASAARAEAVAVISLQMGEFFAEAGVSFDDLRREVLAGRRMKLDDVLDRAIERGEIDAGRLTPRVRELPLHLLRHELLMTLKPVPKKTIEDIIDEIFLPLARPERAR